MLLPSRYLSRASTVLRQYSCSSCSNLRFDRGSKRVCLAARGYPPPFNGKKRQITGGNGSRSDARTVISAPLSERKIFDRGSKLVCLAARGYPPPFNGKKRQITGGNGSRSDAR